jgi:acetyl esterase/lipase
VALDPTSGNITDWNAQVVAKIRGVVSLSGVSDLGSRDHDADLDLTDFIFTVENYTNTHAMMEWYYIQEAASPITLVANAAYIPPIRLYATQHDTVPHQQAENMKFALQTRGADVAEYTMNGSTHCFNQWQIVNSVTQQCVRDEVTKEKRL